MSDIVLQKNVGGLVTLEEASTGLSWTAGGTGDSATWTGLSIDREGFGSGSLPLSALFGVLYSATLSSGKTLSIGIDVQHSADNINWSDYATVATTVVATGPSGGGSVVGRSNVAVDLTNAKRYVRCNQFVDLSATGTDTAIAVASAVLAGYDRLAAPV